VKNILKNWSIFGYDMDKTLRLTFLGPTMYVYTTYCSDDEKKPEGRTNTSAQ